VVFVAAAQQPADPKQWIVLVPAMPERLLLHPAADLVEGVEAEPDYVEGVQHPGGVRQAGAQRGGTPAERVQRRHPHAVAPGLRAAGNPAGQPVNHARPRFTGSRRLVKHSQAW
jgi:hypothetical protein